FVYGCLRLFYGSKYAAGLLRPAVTALQSRSLAAYLHQDPSHRERGPTKESDAILKYLVTKYDIPEHWYPRQPERRARVDEYTAFHHSYTRPHAAAVFILEVLLPAQTGAPVDEERLNHALVRLDDTLDKLESMFLRRQPFLCGDDITVADLLAVCELMQPMGGDRDVLKLRPLLQHWRSRVQSAVGEAFDNTHRVLYNVRERRRAKL
uniref:glutathione transferase n=1 Tax=Gouania willdenowi TaxID=441366 RepID=A0A8C5E4W1_GOUWI